MSSLCETNKKREATIYEVNSGMVRKGKVASMSVDSKPVTVMMDVNSNLTVVAMLLREYPAQESKC